MLLSPQYGERLAGLLAAGGADSGGVKAGHLVVDRLVGAHRAGQGRPLQAVGSLDYRGHGPTVESLGQGVPGGVGHVGVRGRLDEVTSDIVSPAGQTLVQQGRGHSQQLGNLPQKL